MFMHPDNGLFLDIGSNPFTEVNFGSSQYAVPNVDAFAADFSEGLDEGFLPISGKDQQSFLEPFNEEFRIPLYVDDNDELFRQEHGSVRNIDPYKLPQARPLAPPLWRASMLTLPEEFRDPVSQHSFRIHEDKNTKISPSNENLPKMDPIQTSPGSLYSNDNSISMSIASSEGANPDYAGFFGGNNDFGSPFGSVASAESVSSSLPRETIIRKRKRENLENDTNRQPQLIPTVPLTETLEVSNLYEQKAMKKLKPERSNVRFQCAYCDTSCKVKSYLTRHLKKHSSNKPFNCPFYGKSLEGSFGAIKCHSTGGFSRRDTYKTHLKALHFIYPPGTKSNERNFTAGRCAGCLEYFENNTKWLLDHIERGRCSAQALDLK